MKLYNIDDEFGIISTALTSEDTQVKQIATLALASVLVAKVPVSTPMANFVVGAQTKVTTALYEINDHIVLDIDMAIAYCRKMYKIRQEAINGGNSLSTITDNASVLAAIDGSLPGSKTRAISLYNHLYALADDLYIAAVTPVGKTTVDDKAVRGAY